MHDVLKSTSAFLAGVAVIALAYGTALSTPSFAEKTVMVGGAEMFPSKNIIQNAINSQDHTTLVAAVKAAGLVDTLSGAGPFTVFAPTNRAFEKLPDGTVPTLLKPENKGKLTSILTYHVVPGHAHGEGSVGHGRQDGRQGRAEDGQRPSRCGSSASATSTSPFMTPRATPAASRSPTCCSRTASSTSSTTSCSRTDAQHDGCRSGPAPVDLRAAARDRQHLKRGSVL